MVNAIGKCKLWQATLPWVGLFALIFAPAAVSRSQSPSASPHGTVERIKPAAKSIELTVRTAKCGRGLKIGDSRLQMSDIFRVVGVFEIVDGSAIEHADQLDGVRTEDFRFQITIEV